MLRVIITGATGMVGEGVLHQCLLHPQVEAVLIINRKPSGFTHAKLKEIVHADMSDLSRIEGQLGGYNACFFCAGVSAVGMKEVDYFRITYDLTMGFAHTLSRLNTDMTFCYVSGASTDSTEKGRSMWARVKGKTENDLMKLAFRQVVAFRPGYMHPTPGLKNTLPFYKYIKWIYYIGRPLSNGGFMLLEELGLAMINVALHGSPKKVLEGKDIIDLAGKAKR